MTNSKIPARRPLRVAALIVVAMIFTGCGEQGADPGKLLADAKQLHEKGNYNEAIIQLKNLVQKSPENAEARYFLGVTYLDSGDLRSAEKELRKALDLRYDRSRVIAPLGKTLLTLGEYQKVLDEVRVEGEVPNLLQAEILTLRALASIALRRNQEGRELLAQALAKQPEYADALLGQARLAAGEKNLDEALRLVERALTSAPSSVDAWLMKGDLNRIASNSKAAQDAYQKALEFKPDNVAAHLNMTSLHIAGGNFDEAEKQLDRVRKIAANNPMATYLQALIEFRKKNYAAARDAVARVLKVASNHVPSMRLAGAIEFALGSQVQAQSYLEQVVNRVPNDLYARRLLISSFAKSNQLPRAIEHLQAGLKLSPEDPVMLTLAGEIYMQNNEFPKATAFFEKAAKLDPKSAGVRTELGLSRLASGDNERAIADLESAGQLDGAKYQADIVLVMSHLKRANYEQALKAMQSLEKKQPDNPLTYNLKAAIFLGKKDHAGARKQLERALELQPAYVPAAMNLAQLDLQEKNPQAARRRFEVVLEKDKDNVQALLALANFGPRIGATQKEQFGWLERAGKASPGSIQPQLMLARLHLQSGDAKQALEAARRAQALGAENPEVLETLGAIQVSAGEKEQAVATFGKLVQLQPKSAVALYRLATAQSVNGDQPGAAGSLRKALSLQPEFIDAHVALANLELRAARYAEATKIAQQVQKYAAKSPVGYALEGDVLVAEKKYLQAAKVYEQAYNMGKNTATVIKLHTAYTLAGKADDADARLKQWLKDSPGDGMAKLYAAEADLKAGRFRDAAVHYEWLLQKQPDNVVILNNLAWAYQQTKDKRALETAERAYKLKPDNAAIADTLGWLLVEQGSYPRGLELLQKAVNAAPNSPEIRFHLAQGWIKSGEKVKARNELERLLSTDVKFPAQAEAFALLKQLRN